MTRDEFAKLCTLFGVSLPMQSTLLSCEKGEILTLK